MKSFSKVLWMFLFGFPAGAPLCGFLASCSGDISTVEDSVPVTNNLPLLPPAPQFNADSAFLYIKEQVDFGPRVPGTSPHARCASYLVEKLRSFGWETQVQTGLATLQDKRRINLKNIIASYKPENKNRILLMAHWDTRSRADRDSVNKDQPIDGADDGGSGVGVLLEIARQFSLSKIDLGLDILFFDAEDDGDYGTADSWCLGSQYWSKNPHQPGYTAQFGILLDMVGSKNATFPREGLSRTVASSVVNKIWNKASYLGYSNYFILKDGGAITDDHVYVINNAKIPSVDIVNMNTETGDFGHYHHRHSDNMSVIDTNTLKAVGQTVLEVLWEEQNKTP